MSSPALRQGYIETDAGLRLFWEAHGDGPGLVCCNGVGVSTFFWKYLVEGFSDRYTVLLWDYRGHGQSDRPEMLEDCDLSIGASARDLQKVMDAACLEKAVILGHSMGCQVALELAHQVPERVSGLVLMQGSAGRVLETFFDNPTSKRVHRLLMRAADRLGPKVDLLMGPLLTLPIAWEFAWRSGMVDPYYTKKEDFLPYLEHLAALDTRLFLHMVQEAHEHDAFPHLPNIKQPVLVVAGEKDTFTPMWLSKRIVRELPNAELLVLADATHAAIIEHPVTINHRVKRFLEKAKWLPKPTQPEL
jgi:pimeloyl-ACP methyl ester carboxylesterase